MGYERILGHLGFFWVGMAWFGFDEKPTSPSLELMGTTMRRIHRGYEHTLYQAVSSLVRGSARAQERAADWIFEAFVQTQV